MRMIASVELAHAEVGLGETSQAERHAAESLRAARRLHNLNVAAYALELWAGAELRDGRIERAGWLVALSDRSYRQAGSHPWRTTSELHDQVHRSCRSPWVTGTSKFWSGHETLTWMTRLPSLFPRNHQPIDTAAVRPGSLPHRRGSSRRRTGCSGGGTTASTNDDGGETCREPQLVRHFPYAGLVLISVCRCVAAAGRPAAADPEEASGAPPRQLRQRYDGEWC